MVSKYNISHILILHGRGMMKWIKIFPEYYLDIWFNQNKHQNIKTM